MSSTNKRNILILLVIVLIIVVIPLILLPGAEFEGSDDGGSDVVSEVTGTEYEPWFTPVAETVLGGEIPGEIETLLFTVQTGIGVGILFFFIGKFSERTRREKETGQRIDEKKKIK